ncbi:MAG: hypothetical protein H0U74_03085 [Bradymonadaceae bacterium]|nr:hypothetical protein [Lujinxingiaceae bacterium]
MFTRSNKTTRWFQRPGLRRLAGCVLCLALISAPATSAFALDKNQIIQMSKLGLDERAIRGAIDSAGDELMLSEADLAELRSQGVKDGVIEHLKRSGHVKGAKPAAGGTPAPGDDINLEPAPAPAVGEGESEEEREERERLERERQAEIARAADELNRQRAADEQRDSQLGVVARKLPGAATALRANNNMQAARTYLEFLALDPDPESPEWYEARFGLSKALYQQGILSGATTPLLETLMAGADKPHFEEAFEMLGDLTRKIGYRPPVLEELTRSYVGDKGEGFQNQYNYYMGKFFFDYNRTDLALQYLQEVKPAAKDYPSALYLMGVAQLDPSVNDIGGALRNFERAILAAEASPGSGNEEVLQLGYLALARVFYEVGLYDVALFYYQKLPSNSSRSASAQFEQAWTYFLKNDHKRALGVFHTLHSPYFGQWYFPDLYILEATVYLNLCKFPQSQRAMTEFRAKYLDKRPLLQNYLQQTSEPADYWNMITRAQGKQGAAKGGPLPALFVNAVLENVSFYNIYNVVQALRNEKRALESNISTLGEFGEEVLDRVNEQLETKIQEGGIMVQQRLSSVDQELQDWEIKAMQISFDIDSEERQQIQERLVNPDYEPPVVEAGTTLLIVADDWQPWPFEGEYWLDEVSSYRSRLRTECVEQ